MHRPSRPHSGARSVASLAVALGLAASGVSSTVAQSEPASSPTPLGEPRRLPAGMYNGPLGTEQWTVTVPDGWEWFYDVLWSDLGTPGTFQDVGGPGEVALGWWHVDEVFTDPCHWQDSLADPPIGPTADDLATALLAQVGRDDAPPTDVTLGGYPAKRLELKVPADLAACDEGAYRLFMSGGEPFGSGGEPYHPPAGSILAMYILDVGGSRYVLNAWHLPDAADEDLAELEAMLGSILIEATAPLPSPSPLASPRPPIGEVADDGARIVQVDAVDARTRDLTIESPSVGTVGVRLLLPARFEAEPDTAWPVLLLLHGYGGDHAAWTDDIDVEGITGPTDLLVVMPDADNGWYTDAWDGGAGGLAAWETFHTAELLQLIERNWRASDDRVLAGLSMGGLGAMAYAARHPGLFKAAASYSGVLDTTGQDLFDGEAAFGDPAAQAENWKAHNPLDLASKLEGIRLYVSYGDGRPGPLDPPGATTSDLEVWVAPQNDAFVTRLRELGIPVTVDAYGAGTHEWPYWERALRESLPMLLKAIEG